MAQVAAVYTVQAHIRTAESIIKTSEDDNVLPFRTPLEINGFGQVLRVKQKRLSKKRFWKRDNEIRRKKDNGLF
ncbi:hypothetical protein MNBD_GAMMA24-2 [hydrothermal vent metagenome]|uniref:Uncharacterized protein n=1 Tax=hydrothermal vent metagenome TaxID=652676 RepID=A0A3B1B7T7_9ZZZZ